MSGQNLSLDEEQQAEYAALLQMLNASRGTFSISAALSNSATHRDEIIATVRLHSPSVAVVVFGPDITDPYAETVRQTSGMDPSAVFIVGLDTTLSGDSRASASLKALNASRELWERHFRCPVVLWLPEFAMVRLASEAPDFWRYKSHQFSFGKDPSSRTLSEPRTLALTGVADVLGADERELRAAELESRLRLIDRGLAPALEPFVDQWLHGLGELHYLAGRPRQAIDVWGKLAARATHAHDSANLIRASGNLGVAWEALGEYEKAQAHYERQLELAQRALDRQSEAIALSNLGALHIRRGDPVRAQAYINKSIELFHSIGDPSGEADALGNLSTTCLMLGNTTNAKLAAEQSLRLSRASSNRRAECGALGNLGRVESEGGRHAAAVQYYDEALAVAQRIGDREKQVGSLINLSASSARLGDIASATSLGERALALAHEIGSRHAESIAAWNLADAYRAQGEFKRWIELLELRARYLDDIGHPQAGATREFVDSARRSVGLADD